MHATGEGSGAAAAEVNGAVVETELEREDGVLMYSVEFDSGVEVEVDARTGKVLKVDDQDD